MRRIGKPIACRRAKDSDACVHCVRLHARDVRSGEDSGERTCTRLLRLALATACPPGRAAIPSYKPGLFQRSVPTATCLPQRWAIRAPSSCSDRAAWIPHPCELLSVLARGSTWGPACPETRDTRLTCLTVGMVLPLFEIDLRIRSLGANDELLRSKPCLLAAPRVNQLFRPPAARSPLQGEARQKRPARSRTHQCELQPFQ